MLKILLTHKGLTQEELKTRAELHVYKMDDNPVYSEFQPLITAFKPLVATYSVALINAKLGGDRKSTRLNSSHLRLSRMPSSA